MRSPVNSKSKRGRSPQRDGLNGTRVKLMLAHRPKRGEVYWVNLDPVVGAEQGGRRPALILQNDRGNENSSYTVVAALSAAPLPRVYPLTIRYPAGEANLNRPGYVNCAQIRT